MLTALRLREVLLYDPETGAFTWRVQCSHGTRVGEVVGGLRRHGYWSMTVLRGRYYAHRLAWLYMTGNWPKDKIDHINGHRADNRFANLREASDYLNQQNRRAAPAAHNKHSGLVGAYRHGDLWASKIMANRVLYRLGVFRTAEEASTAYRQAKRVLHPGCAR